MSNKYVNLITIIDNTVLSKDQISNLLDISIESNCYDDLDITADSSNNTCTSTHTSTSDEHINYYIHANSKFKNNIKNNQLYIDQYNYWCDIIMGSDEYFIGKFNKDFYKEAHENINNNLYTYLDNISDESALFFFNIFKEIIDKEYFHYIHIKNIHINNLIKNYDKIKEKNNCSICTEKLNKTISLKLPCCKNILHRKCLKKWLLESTTCPICREVLS